MVPQVRGRLLGVLQTLLAVRFETEDRLLVELNEWERNVVLYEQQSGEELSGNIKRAVLQQSLPADLRQALQSKTNIDVCGFSCDSSRRRLGEKGVEEWPCPCGDWSSARVSGQV